MVEALGVISRDSGQVHLALDRGPETHALDLKLLGRIPPKHSAHHVVAIRLRAVPCKSTHLAIFSRHAGHA